MKRDADTLSHDLNASLFSMSHTSTSLSSSITETRCSEGMIEGEHEEKPVWVVAMEKSLNL